LTRVLCTLGATVAVGALLAVSLVARTWLRYGTPDSAPRSDAMLDRFMPAYDVAERHEIRVAAPAQLTYAAAYDVDMRRSRIVRAIFRARELMLRASPPADSSPQPLVPFTKRIGWGVLAEDPGQIVLGAVTRPWEANVRFRSLPPGEFASFSEPGYVKIIWTIAADPLNDSSSVARTETRVATTDGEARRRFRRYWALFSPGILLIRREALALVKTDAEQNFRMSRAGGRGPGANAP
jgi:hypothetical protein